MAHARRVAAAAWDIQVSTWGIKWSVKAWIHCGWHAGVPDLALGCADAVESVEEARDVEGRLGVERSSAKSASMSSPMLQ